MAQPGVTTQPVMPAGGLSVRPQPRLLVGELVLRPWDLEDAPDLVRAYEDPEIHRWHARSLSLSEAQAWVGYENERWTQDRGCSWAITRAGSVCGRVGIGGVDLTSGQAGTTYWVLEASRRQGVATLALGAVVRWAFETAGFHRLGLDHSMANPASCRVALRSGFAAEGTMRAQALHLDGWHDMHLHAILAGDPRPAISESGPPDSSSRDRSTMSQDVTTSVRGGTGTL